MTMTKKLGLAVAATFALALTSAVPAQAALITISDSTPRWQNDNPDAWVVITDNNGDNISVRWGDIFSPSGYDFSAKQTPFQVDTNVNGGKFLLGEFTHLNFPTFLPSLESIELKFSMQIGGGANPSSFQEVFKFHHNETPNQRPCQPGSQSVCDDIVTFSQGTLNSSFELNGTHYVLRLLGFSQDGGNTLTDGFMTKENKKNTAKLYAQIIERQDPTPVPEPTSMFLLGTGLAGLAARRLRRKQ